MKSLEEMLKEIKSVKIQGAKEIAIESLKFLKDYAKTYGFGKKFKIACKKLENARPTAVVLHNCLEILLKEKSEKTIERLINELNQATKKLSEIGSGIIKNNSTILTHCHSGEALSVIKRAWRDGKKIRVFATITEPLLQGVKTAKELAREGIPVTLIADSAVGFFMKDIDMVVVGSDAIREEGVVNKIGTYLFSIAAKYHKKPFYMVGDSFKFDRRKKLIIEERPPSEIYKGLKGVKKRNPAFDIVPWENITALITEKGIMKKRDVMKYLKFR